VGKKENEKTQSNTTNDWVCLGIMLEGIDWDNCISDVGYETAILHTVEPQYIRVLDIPI
jgi:hypothetical protein